MTRWAQCLNPKKAFPPISWWQWGSASLHKAPLSGVALLPNTACYLLVLQEHSTSSTGTWAENFAKVLLSL